MPTSYTETAHACEFILSEASGSRSRENGTLNSGQNLQAGTVLQATGTKLTAFTGTASTDGTPDPAAIGILLYDVDASDGDVACSYLARDAEVNLKLLTYPDEATQDVNGTKNSLKLLGIICRD